MAPGEEAIDEEETRLERFVRAAWQPAARRHQRFLQELVGGDEGEEEVLERMELLDAPVLRLITKQIVTGGWASSRGNQQEVCNIIIQFNL